MNNRAFGLDIGVSTIKAVDISQNGQNFKLSACISTPTPPKGMFSESVADEENMAAVLKKAVDDAGISSRQVSVALPDNQVYTKIVEMPFLSDRELASAINYEAEQYIPIPLPNISLSWNVINRNSRLSDKMLVLMVGAPTLIIKKYQKILSLAGLTVNSMETEILATVRSLTSFTPPGSGVPTLIASIGAINTSLAIVMGQDLVFTYSVPVGGVALNRAIATDFGLSKNQAEQYEEAYGISRTPLGQKIGKATEPIMSSIVSEVKKAIIYYSQKFKDSRIEQIVLSGSSVKLPGIETYFADNLGIEALVANPWKFLNPTGVPKEILNNAPDYSTAVGLALKAYE